MSVNGRLEGGINGALMDAALGTILSPILSKVDQKDIGEVSTSHRQLVHAVLGGVKGVIKSGDILEGLISGVAEEMVLLQCHDAFREDRQQENKVAKIQEVEESAEPKGTKQPSNVSRTNAKFTKQAKDKARVKEPGKDRAHNQGNLAEDFAAGFFAGDPAAFAKYQENLRHANEYQSYLDVIYGHDTFSDATVGKSSGDVATSSNSNSGMLGVLLPTAHASEAIEEATSSSSSNNSKPWLQQYGESYKNLIQDEYEDSLPMASVITGLAHQGNRLITNSYKLLQEQFKPSDFKPIRNYAGVKTHRVGIIKDKRGVKHYKNLTNGRFEKSALQKAKDSERSGEIPVSSVDYLMREKLFDYSRCRELPFGRVKVEGIETGGLAVVCNETYGNASITKEGINMQGSIGFDSRINLASGSSETALGKGRVDAEAAAVTVKMGAGIISNRDSLNIEFDTKAIRKGPTVNAELKSKQICGEENCYQLNTNAYIGTGSGIELGFSYHQNKKNNKRTLAISAGLGKSKMIGMRVAVDVEPNTDVNKKYKPS